MRRVIALTGLAPVLIAGAILGSAPAAPASGDQTCPAAPPATTTSSTTPTTTSSTPPTTTSSTTTTSPAPPPPSIPQPTGHPLNNVTVENCVDGTSQVRSELQVRFVHGAQADPVNFAYAYSHGCSSGCQSIAAAFQVVLVEPPATTQTPENIGLAINYMCDHCGTFAYAYQYVVDVPSHTRLSSATELQIATIERQADADVHAELSFTALDAKLQDLAGQLRVAVDDGLQDSHARETHEHAAQHLRTSGQE